jgi:hypothetical protein
MGSIQLQGRQLLTYWYNTGQISLDSWTRVMNRLLFYKSSEYRLELKDGQIIIYFKNK